MPPIVHLVRHAQAKSNVDPAFRDRLDPELTSIGVQQARDLGLKFPFHEKIETIFSSPLQRALHTAILAFGGNLNTGSKVVALPLAQETSHALCDTGQDVEVLQGLFLEAHIDYCEVMPDWNSKTGKWSQDDVAVEERATSLRDFLASRPEQEVVLVTHGFFLHFLTEDWSELEKNTDWCGFQHCEHRAYTLVMVEGHYKLHETTASRERKSAGAAGLEFTAANYGASEYFAALDADMISEPDWLARTVPHLIKDKDAALVSPPQISYNILAEDELCQDSNVYAQILEPFRDFLACSQCSGSGYVMRRHALDTIGGWPLANIGEDIICSNMLQEQGWNTKYIPDQLQFGLAPDSFHSYINQRIRWTYGSLLVGRRFGFSLQRLGGGDKLTRMQRVLSIMGALKAYASSIAFGAVVCLPACFWALNAGNFDATTGRQHIRLVLMCHFTASIISKKVVYGRLGSMNVFNMTTSRLWTSPFNAFCTLKSLFSDPGETSLKVSGTFVSPTDERYAARRKPLLQRMLNVTMICYAACFLLTSVTLVSFAIFVAHQHLVIDAARMYMHTGAALRLLDIILAALVPLRYMIFPPSLPDRRELLVKDAHGVYRSRKKEWIRDGRSSVKLLLQIAIIGLFDWL